MKPNKVRHYRKISGLTQQALADKVGTSQQQIQRVEAGVIEVRLDLAVQISKALDVALGQAFPAMSASADQKRKRASSRFVPDEAGIDLDPAYWRAEFFIEDGRTLLFDISSSDKVRLESIVSGGSSKSFLVFNSGAHCIALRRDSVNVCRFLFERFAKISEESDDESYQCVVAFIGAKETVRIGLVPDQMSVVEDDDGSQSQLQRVFLDLDGFSGDDDGVVAFDDEDGESVIIRTKKLLLLKMPLACCEPALLESEDEGADENEEELIRNRRADDSAVSS